MYVLYKNQSHKQKWSSIATNNLFKRWNILLVIRVGKTPTQKRMLVWCNHDYCQQNENFRNFTGWSLLPSQGLPLMSIQHVISAKSRTCTHVVSSSSRSGETLHSRSAWLNWNASKLCDLRTTIISNWSVSCTYAMHVLVNI